MSLSPLSLCSKALLSIGASSISSFEEGTAESEIAQNLYPTIRDGLLSSHPWSFATKQVSLGLLETAPKADFAYSYLLPSDFLRAISLGTGRKGRGIEYRISGNTLETNYKNITLTYISRPDESVFPAFFIQLFIYNLASEFCLPLTDNSSKAEYLFKKAEEVFKRAKLLDSQQEMPKAIEDYSLIEVRK